MLKGREPCCGEHRGSSSWLILLLSAPSVIHIYPTQLLATPHQVVSPWQGLLVVQSPHQGPQGEGHFNPKVEGGGRWRHWAPSSQALLKHQCSSFDSEPGGGVHFLRPTFLLASGLPTPCSNLLPQTRNFKPSEIIVPPPFLLQGGLYLIPLNFSSWQLSPDPNFLLKHTTLRTFPCLLLGLLTVFYRSKKTISLFSSLAQPTRNSWQLCK